MRFNIGDTVRISKDFDADELDSYKKSKEEKIELTIESFRDGAFPIVCADGDSYLYFAEKDIRLVKRA